jgi:hypothetical protein
MSSPHPPSPSGAAPERKGPMVAQRTALPTTRDSITHKFQIMGHEGYLTIGLFSDGQPGEIFVKMAKEGSTLSGLVQGFCRAFSLALQYGLPLQEAVSRFKGMRFEPMGSTSNPDIPEALSIIDYVARYLEFHFMKSDELRM